MGHYPDQWKSAKIIFLLKPEKGCSFSHTNYSPISLLEKMIHSHLMHILEQRTMDNDRQNIFRPKHGTQKALAIIYESIATSKANKHNIDIALGDVSRAFDKVCIKFYNSNSPNHSQE